MSPPQMYTNMDKGGNTMLKRYAIWDKQSPVITPIGEVLTPEQWIDRYPAAEHITYVCAAGEVNGAFSQSLSSLVMLYENQGADFSEANTDEEKLEVIEAFEDAMNDPGDITESSPEERIAAALELSNLMNMPDENTDDPDLI